MKKYEAQIGCEEWQESSEPFESLEEAIEWLDDWGGARAYAYGLYPADYAMVINLKTDNIVHTYDFWS